MMLKRKGGYKRCIIMCKFKGWMDMGGHYDVK